MNTIGSDEVDSNTVTPSALCASGPSQSSEITDVEYTAPAFNLTTDLGSSGSGSNPGGNYQQKCVYNQDPSNPVTIAAWSDNDRYWISKDKGRSGQAKELKVGPGSINRWTAVGYGNGTWVLLGGIGHSSGTTAIAYSTNDGDTWDVGEYEKYNEIGTGNYTQVNNNTTQGFYDVAFGRVNGVDMFIAVWSASTGSGQAYRSLDGITWDGIPQWNGTSGAMTSVAYGDGKFIIAGKGNDPGGGGMWITYDGYYLQRHLSPPVAGNPGYLQGSPPKILQSQWTSITKSPGSKWHVTENYAIGSIETDIQVSEDGLTWTDISIPDEYYKELVDNTTASTGKLALYSNIKYGNGQYYAFIDYVLSTSKPGYKKLTKVLYSPDGVVWSCLPKLDIPTSMISSTQYDVIGRAMVYHDDDWYISANPGVWTEYPVGRTKLTFASNDGFSNFADGQRVVSSNAIGMPQTPFGSIHSIEAASNVINLGISFDQSTLNPSLPSNNWTPNNNELLLGRNEPCPEIRLTSSVSADVTTQTNLKSALEGYTASRDTFQLNLKNSLIADGYTTAEISTMGL